MRRNQQNVKDMAAADACAWAASAELGRLAPGAAKALLSAHIGCNDAWTAAIQALLQADSRSSDISSHNPGHGRAQHICPTLPGHDT